jgi:LmbE family N-acetylglucosaminyl deacetylase
MLTDAGATLFLVAHPDDEFFCSPFLSDELAAGREVIVAYLTDGAWGGQSIQCRIKESLGILTRLGVSERHVHFLGSELSIPDGGLVDHMRIAYEAVRQRLVGPGTRIYTTAWEGGHQDHDACHAIAVRLGLQDGNGEVYQFPLYNAMDMTGPLFKVMSPLKQNGSIDSRALTWRERFAFLRNAFGYPSQWKTWLGLLPFAASRVLAEGKVVRQPAHVDRLAARPHEGPLLYEKRGKAQFEAVSRRIEAFLEDTARD